MSGVLWVLVDGEDRPPGRVVLRFLHPLDGEPDPFHQITGISVGGALGDGLALDGQTSPWGSDRRRNGSRCRVGECLYCGLLLVWVTRPVTDDPQLGEDLVCDWHLVPGCPQDLGVHLSHA